MLAVCLIRLLGSSLILRYPLFGALVAIGLDYVDMRILEYFERGDLTDYQIYDKLLDLFYLCLEAYIANHWKNNLARLTAISLFFYRLVGITLFEVTQISSLLFVFPNIFEYFYLAYLIQLKIAKKDLLVKPASILVVIFILALIKLPHEYLLHINTTHPWTNNYYVSRIIDPDFVEKVATEVSQTTEEIKKISP